MFVVQALCLVLFVAVSLVSCQNSLTLLNGDYTVTWKHLSATKEIQFTVTAKTTGYVAFGISNFNSQMKDIDVMVGKVVGGTPSIQDRWSSGYGTPSNELQQDFLVQGTEANGETVLTFKRKLDTGDAANDIKIEVGKQYYLVAAVGSSDTFEQHGNAASNTRGYSPQKVTLVAQPLSPSPSTASSTSMRTPSPTTAVSSSPLTTSAIPQPTRTTTVAPTSSATPVSDNMVSFKDGSVSWTVDNKNSEITFTMKAKAIGWLGLGITEENTGMKNMDVAIGGVDNSNMPYLNQYFSSSTVKPEINKLNNLKMISSHQDVDKRETTITFKRSWRTGDSRDIIIKPDSGYYLAWAYHKTGDTLTVHDERGYTDKVVLVKSSASSKASCISVVAMAIVLVVLMMQ